MPEIFYLLACRECGDPDRPLVMPFGSAEERGKWASGHTQATGHTQWRVMDQATTDGLPSLDAWHLEFATPKWRVILAYNAEAAAVKKMAEYVFAEKDAEIARLQAELDGMRQVPVEYAPTAALEAAMAADPAREDGTILRETGGERRAFEWRAATGEWVGMTDAEREQALSSPSELARWIEANHGDHPEWIAELRALLPREDEGGRR